MLEKKGFEFSGKQGCLYVKDNKRNTLLQAKRTGTVYPLLQSTSIHNTVSTTHPIYKTSKPVARETWHQRAAHLNYRDLAVLPKVTEGVVFTPEVNPTDQHDAQFCDACAQGKQHKVHNKEPATNRATEAGIRLHADLFGGGDTLKSVEGYRYGGVVTDDATRMRFSMTLKTKDTICKELIGVFNQVKTHTERDLEYFRSDDAGEYQGLQPTFQERGIIWEKSAPYAQDQDGVSERSIRTILERARTMLIHAGLPSSLWPEAIAAACYITNRLPTTALEGKTPYEAWYKKKPDLSNLRVYGCNAYVIDYHAKSKGKMAPRSWIGTLVGYEGKNQWRIYDGNKVFVRRDVLFNESKFHYKDLKRQRSEPVGVLSEDYVDIAGLFPPVGDSTEPLLPQHRRPHTPVEDIDRDGVTDNSEKLSFPITPLPDPVDDAFDIVNNLLRETQERNQTELAALTPPVEDNPLILREPRSKVRHNYKKLNTKGFVKAAKPLQKVIEPKTYEEALSGPYAKEWQQAMKEEYDSQIERGTFVVTTLPYDYKVIPGKWVYRVKERADGSIERFKARWVA